MTKYIYHILGLCSRFPVTAPQTLVISWILRVTKLPFVTFMRWLLESTWGWGLVTRGASLVIGIFIPSHWPPWREERAGHWVGLATGNDLFRHVYVWSLRKMPHGLGSENFHQGTHEMWGERLPWSGHGSLPYVSLPPGCSWVTPFYNKLVT